MTTPRPLLTPRVSIFGICAMLGVSSCGGRVTQTEYVPTTGCLCGDDLYASIAKGHYSNHLYVISVEGPFQTKQAHDGSEQHLVHWRINGNHVAEVIDDFRLRDLTEEYWLDGRVFSPGPGSLGFFGVYNANPESIENPIFHAFQVTTDGKTEHRLFDVPLHPARLPPKVSHNGRYAIMGGTFVGVHPASADIFDYVSRKYTLDVKQRQGLAECLNDVESPDILGVSNDGRTVAFKGSHVDESWVKWFRLDSGEVGSLKLQRSASIYDFDDFGDGLIFIASTGSSVEIVDSGGHVVATMEAPDDCRFGTAIWDTPGKRLLISVVPIGNKPYDNVVPVANRRAQAMLYDYGSGKSLAIDIELMKK